METQNVVADLAEAMQLPAPKSTVTLNEIRAWVKREIAWLVARDHEKLKEVLYRVDVDEKFLLDALAAYPEEKVDVLTDLIISRQLQKAETKKANPQAPAVDQNEAL